jgi:hypothetical protein
MAGAVMWGRRLNSLPTTPPKTSMSPYPGSAAGTPQSIPNPSRKVQGPKGPARHGSPWALADAEPVAGALHLYIPN